MCAWVLSYFSSVPARFLFLWDAPGKNTGVGCHVLLQGIFPTQGSNPHLLKLLHASGFLTTEPPWGTPNIFQPSAKNWHEMEKWMCNCGRLRENSHGYAPTTRSSCYLCRGLRIRDCCYTHWQTNALAHKSTLLGQKISALQELKW